MDDTAPSDKPVIPQSPATPATPPIPSAASPVNTPLTPEFSPEPPPDIPQPPPQAGIGQAPRFDMGQGVSSPPPPPPPPPQSGEVTLAGGEAPQAFPTHRPVRKIAIVIGIILAAAGLVVGVFFFLQGSGEQTPVVEQPGVTPTPAQLTLSIENPKNGQVSSTEEITVSGKTLSGGVVGFVTNVDGSLVQSDDSGSFTARALLGPGINEILAVAVDASGQTKEDTIYTVFDADEKNQTAIAGVVTTIRDGIFSLKQKQGTSLSVGTNSSTVVVGGGAIPTIKVGDVLVAIATESVQATVSGTQIATKLYVKEASPSALSSKKPQVMTGVIAGINDAIVTIKENNAEVFHEFAVASSSAIKTNGGTGIAALQLGQQILAIVAPGLTDELLAKLIHVLDK